MTPKQLKKIRKEYRVSQFKLSRLTGISRNRITLFECNYKPLTGVELKSITQALREVGAV